MAKKKSEAGNKSIPIQVPFFDSAEEEALARVIQSGWPGAGSEVASFEKEMAKEIGCKWGIAVNSGTSALIIALLAAGIKRGDVVAVSAFSFVATVNAIEHVGAKPLFVDIDLNTYNISTDTLWPVLKAQAEEKQKMRALLVVHEFGLIADIGPFYEKLPENNILVIEDAACALGSVYQGKKAGELGDVACFSFHPRKLITTGEGGMVVTEDDAIARASQSLRNHGLEQVDQTKIFLPNFKLLGFNMRMSDLQATVGRCQLQKLSKIMEGRQKAALYYQEKLQEVDWLVVPSGIGKEEHNHQSYVCRINVEKPDRVSEEKLNSLRKKRDQLLTKLNDQGIGARPAAYSLHTLPYFKEKYKLSPMDFPKAYAADSTSFALPLFCGIKKEEQDRVIEALKKASDLISD
jgi:perosamine synthetase